MFVELGCFVFPAVHSVTSVLVKGRRKSERTVEAHSLGKRQKQEGQALNLAEGKAFIPVLSLGGSWCGGREEHDFGNQSSVLHQLCGLEEVAQPF